jgi:hypothetical protein
VVPGQGREWGVPGYEQNSSVGIRSPGVRDSSAVVMAAQELDELNSYDVAAWKV